MRTYAAFALTLLLSGSGAAAEAPVQAPWLVPLEERIALRTNPELARQRVLQTRHAPPSDTPARRPVVDAFYGREHPELFLPVQAFEKLIFQAYVAPPRFREVIREMRQPHVVRLGLSDFWNRLHAAAAEYIVLAAQEREIGASLRESDASVRGTLLMQIRHVQQRGCSSRVDALAAARREFGHETFDRFLYEAVVPEMFIIADDALPTPGALRRLEEGCR